MLVSILAFAACGDSGTEEPGAPSASATVDDTSAPPSTDTPTAEPRNAECTVAAIIPVVAAELDPNGAGLGTVKTGECHDRYARVFVPEGTTRFETEQLFLKDADGA